jgi:uncharacterized membrane protein
MELLILRFSGAHEADEALKVVEVVADAETEKHGWLHEVSVVRRPLVGRITIRATYADDEPVKIRQGDLSSETGEFTGYFVGSLFGPLSRDMAALGGAADATSVAKSLEKQLLRVDDIRRVLPRGSSALVLVATPDVNDRMARVFADWSPDVIRRDVGEETERRLQAFDRQTRAGVAEGQGVSP